jgi:hypothetical protein
MTVAAAAAGDKSTSTDAIFHSRRRPRKPTLEMVREAAVVMVMMRQRPTETPAD